ncbi:sigma-54-dependent Fis family transcriptional regulator [Roseateles koreensis]|uniref:Sigma-54-dependent Fis family transcriptional regulator n=1 Tax=Roseateles koreensis TaxID=2987526 RepID=A0ABT5KU92_9BURK|nr:sigma-54-dependent Fis family transcriptional regulator [Roseateles koreensis]MDC8785332.1 sigma-54-dependent Fis family transcriptional regulator [Roseateles koreensis]
MAQTVDQMFSNPGDELAVTQAWESFLNGQTRSAGALRTLVDVSWQRCAEANVDPNRRAGPTPVSEQDLYLLRERRRDLLEASAPVMACARDYLAETGALMALADAQSAILSTEGDSPALSLAEHIQLVPGTRWSEHLCGTNAIGTALAVGQPVQIHSAEHFCAGIKRWTCSATVVRHPADGEIIGVVDVSGLSSTFNRQSLALVVTTASRIENRLVMAEMERRYRLLDVAMAPWSAAGRDAVVLFDRRGCPIKASEHAQIAIADAGGALDLASVRSVPAFSAASMRRGVGHAQLPAWIRAEWIEPLVVKGEHLGTLLVMRSSQGRARWAAPPAAERQPLALAPATPPELASFSHVLTEDPAMLELIQRAQQLARSKVPVLLQGETGAGKEEFAKGIHGARKGSYVALNCGGLSRELLASELFGYADGAFTGARKGGMVGKIEAAHGGTLFLDEIGEMPLDMQPQLLRVLEQGELYRLGDNAPRRVDFRLVAATHRDLRQEVAAGRFRMDLYYRVAVTSLRIPALRERPGDIALLARHFLERFRREQGQVPEPLAAPVLAGLLAYSWPGNVRELRNVIEGAVLTCPEGLSREDQLQLDPGLFADLQAPAPGGVLGDEDGSVASMAEGEERLIARAVAASGGNLTLAARRLNIAKSTLYAKMRRYGLSRDGIAGAVTGAVRGAVAGRLSVLGE